MNNPFDELRAALNQAREVERACGANANAMADLLIGNLRKLSSYRLEQLKRELRDFNIQTGRWKATK